MRLYGLEIFLRVDGGGAFDENVERIGGDDVVLVFGCEDVVARVVINDLGFGIVEDVVILLRKIARGSGRDHGFNFADRNFLDAWIGGESAGGNACAESDTQHGDGMRVKQRGKMTYHPLQLHVEGFGGGFDVAIDVNFDRAVVPLRDGDRRIDTFDGVENLRRR